MRHPTPFQVEKRHLQNRPGVLLPQKTNHPPTNIFKNHLVFAHRALAAALAACLRWALDIPDQRALPPLI
jgi:hypothetical protein